MLIGKNPLKEQPDWFKKNIEIIPLSFTVEVDDKNIKYFIWGDQSLPPVFVPF